MMNHRDLCRETLNETSALDFLRRNDYIHIRYSCDRCERREMNVIHKQDSEFFRCSVVKQKSLFYREQCLKVENCHDKNDIIIDKNKLNNLEGNYLIKQKSSPNEGNAKVRRCGKNARVGPKESETWILK